MWAYVGIRAQHCSFSSFFFFSSNNPSVELVPPYFSSQPLLQAGEESGEREGKEKRKEKHPNMPLFPCWGSEPGAPKVSAEKGDGRQAGAGAGGAGGGMRGEEDPPFRD